MLPDRLLLPTASTTSTRASLVPSICSRLAPRPTDQGSSPGRWRLGDLAVHCRPIRFGGWPRGWRAVFFPACSSGPPYLCHPCRLRTEAPALARENLVSGSRDRSCPRSVKRRRPLRSGMTSIVGPRVQRGLQRSLGGHVRLPLRFAAPCFFARGPRAFARWPRVETPVHERCPHRVKWERSSLCVEHGPSTSATLRYDARAHPRASSPRPRAAWGRFRPRRCVVLRFPRAPFGVRGVRQPFPVTGKGRQRATPAPPLPFLGSTSLPRSGASVATALRVAACEATTGFHRRLRRGWSSDGDVKAWAEQLGAKAPHDFPGPKPAEPWKAPLLRSARAPSGSSGRHGVGRQESPSACSSRPRSPSRPPPRRGGSSRQSGCFRPPGNFGVCSLVAGTLAYRRPLVTRHLARR